MAFPEPTSTTTPISTSPIPTVTVKASQLENEVKELKERLDNLSLTDSESSKS